MRLLISLCGVFVFLSSNLVYAGETFAHVVPYGLAQEYTGAYQVKMQAALAELETHDTAALIYSHMGLLEKWHRDGRARGGLISEKVYNRDFIADAVSAGTKVWLQVTPYHNWTLLRDGSYLNLTAAEILEEKPEYKAAKYQNRFIMNLRESLKPYIDQYKNSNDCRISFLEESTPYHSKHGGGLFWEGREEYEILAGDPDKSISLPITEERNRKFYQRQAKIFEILKREVSRMTGWNGKCLVGMHTGHFPSDHKVSGDSKPMLGMAIDLMKEWLEPDFVILGSYIKARPTYADWEASTRNRVLKIQSFGPKVYMMNQLHVVNNFQHGVGRVPSVSQMRSNLRLAQELGVDGYGYYAKDTGAAARYVSSLTYSDVEIKPKGGGDNIDGQELSGEVCWARVTNGKSHLPDVFEDITPGGSGATERVFYNRRRGIRLNYACTAAEDSSNYRAGATGAGWVRDTAPDRWLFGLSLLSDF